MHLDEFLLATVILLCATAIFVSLFKRFELGSVLGFLAAGVILGPSAITEDVEGLRHFTELGVVLLGERGEMATKHGEASFAILIMQNLAIVPLLALLPLLSDAPALAPTHPLWLEIIVVVGAVGAVVLVGRYLFPIALAAAAKSRNEEAFIMFAMLAACAPDGEADALIEDYRRDDYALMREVQKS